MTVLGDPTQNTHDAACDVLDAIPARDEAELVADCRAAGREAGEQALAAGRVRRVRVAVAAHRCTDDKAALARAGGFPPRQHGEERGPVEAVRQQGGTVLTSFAPMVAEHGLGGLGRALADHRMQSGDVPIDAVPIEPGAA